MTEQPSPEQAPPLESGAPKPPNKKKSDLGARLVTVAIGVPLLLWLLWSGSVLGFTILIAAASLISAWELMGIVTTDAPNRILQCVASLGTLGFCLVLLLGSTPEAAADGHWVLLSAVGALIAVFITALFTFKENREVTLHVGAGAMALIYAGALPATLGLLFRDTGAAGGAWVFMAMAVVWGGDTGAYFAGRAFGKHKLAPRVSPKKTIEGAVGGMLASVLVALVFKQWMLPDLSFGQVLLLAIPANVLGQIGDLCESLIKRAHGVKDSGVIIYGHGGLLDRIDALIFAAPWFYGFFRYLA